MKRLSFFYVVLFCALAGCVTLGKGYEETMSMAPPQAADSVRLFFFRTTENGLYSARSAAITVDDSSVGSCPMGGFFYIDVAPGSRIIATDMWDLPGSCTLTLHASEGEAYYFEVTARMESYKLFLTTGFIGNAVEASEKTCSGAFALVPTEKEKALELLSSLRAVK